jgi:hypothetical protein
MTISGENFMNPTRETGDRCVRRGTLRRPDSLSTLQSDIWNITESECRLSEFVKMVDPLFRDVRFGDTLGHPVGFVIRRIFFPRPPVVDVEFLRTLLPEFDIFVFSLLFGRRRVEPSSRLQRCLAWRPSGKDACLVTGRIAEREVSLLIRVAYHDYHTFIPTQERPSYNCIPKIG